MDREEAIHYLAQAIHERHGVHGLKACIRDLIHTVEPARVLVTPPPPAAPPDKAVTDKARDAVAWAKQHGVTSHGDYYTFYETVPTFQQLAESLGP